MTAWDPKDPADVANYALGWTNILGGDTISALSSVTIAPVTTPALVADTQSFTTTTTTVKLSGGKAGTDYTVTFRVTTTGGQTLERSALVRVRDQ